MHVTYLPSPCCRAIAMLGGVAFPGLSRTSAGLVVQFAQQHGQ
jgi:hypothetical protein